MRALTFSLVMLTAATAAAQPAPAPTPAPADPAPAPAPCTVNLVLVPDDVRPVIEEWVGAETRCAVRLSVRVLAVENGLYVLASDETGRVYERIVPDALTAAVLIASWVADDGGPAPAPAPSPSPAPAPTPPPEAVVPAEAPAPPTGPTTATPAPAPAPMPPAPLAGPSTYTPVDAPVLVVRGTARRGIMAGAMFDLDSAGVRLELDWYTWRKIKLGLALSGVHTEIPYGPDGDLRAREVRLMVQAAKSWRWGRYEARVAVGLGATVSEAEGHWMEGVAYRSEKLGAVSPSGEAAAIGSVWFGSWAARAGVVSAFLPSIERGGLYWDRGVEPRAYVGVGRAW